MTQPITRRTFVAGSLAAGALVITGCTSGVAAPEASTLFLRPTFADGFRQPSTIVAGMPQRLAFVLSDEIANLIDDAPEVAVVSITDAAGATLLSTELNRRQDGIITPYYSMDVTFTEPGLYQAELTEVDGTAAEPIPIEFLVIDPTEGTIPQVGDPLPALDTPTTADPMGIEQLCTRAAQCPFHELNLANSVTNGRPTVLLVATPGFCQTDICGPVVDLLIDAAATRADLDVIHLEVWNDPSAFAAGQFPDLVAAVDELGLTFEPSLFVADATGTIVSRLDMTFDAGELADALALVS